MKTKPYHAQIRTHNAIYERARVIHESENGLQVEFAGPRAKPGLDLIPRSDILSIRKYAD